MQSQTDMLQTAVKLHQQGKLSEADQLYQQILRADPRHYDALHFAGVIAKQTGNPDAAIALITEAIASAGTALSAMHASAFCNLGASYQDKRQPELALKSYQQAIRLKPDYAMAHNNLGNTYKILGQYSEALASYQRAIDLKPDYAEAFYNLGLTLDLAGQEDDALFCFDQALQARPHYAEAYFARGAILQKMASFDLAVESYNQAIDSKVDYAEAYFNRGIVHNRLQQFQYAVSSFELALQYRPDYAKACFYMGNALKQLNRKVEAVAAYQRAGILGADQELVEFVLATLGAGQAPEAPPAAYIRELFDQYADHFDAHLTQVLGYTMPQHIAKIIEPHREHDRLVTLDLGCGTGLCGPHLRPWSQTLTGVDLSQNMLHQAAKLAIYDDLICAEVTAFLFGYNKPTDLIVAADVLVYIGDLEPLLQGAARVLRPAGLFCFSVEDSQYLQTTGDYVLQATNRYAHSEDYLRKLANQSGFIVKVITSQSGRRENQHDSPALIVLLQKMI